jgi:hypothetical protein
MKNSKFRRKMLSIGILLAAFFYSSASFAAPITITTPDPLANGTIGVSYTHTFTATGDLAGAVWQINPGDVGALTALGLSFNAATQTLSGSPTLSTPPTGLSFRVDVANGSGGADEKNFIIIINRIPLDLMLVLDMSGSMGFSFDATNFSAPVGQRRWDGLVTGVSVMVSNLNNPANLLEKDRIGLRYFQTSVFTPPSAPFNAGLVPMNGANLSLLNTEVASRGPGTNTALGDGILAGKGILLPGTAGNRKAMIVFSDGVQNSGDQVRTAGDNMYKQTMSGADLSKSGTDVYPINTICLGSSGDNPTLMQGIATSNGPGEYFNSLTGDNNDFIMNSFLGSIQHILSGSSPAYVDVRSGQFKSDSASRTMSLKESFTVNKSVSSVFVALAAANRLEPFIKSVMKDGVELIQFVHSSNGSGYRSFYINFPLASLPAERPEGEWVITAVTGAGSAGTGTAMPPSYTISMTVEDHLNHLSFSLSGNDLKVGDSLHPAVSIKRGASSLGTATVQAIVLKPGDDINDLLARSNVSFTNPPGDSSTPNIGKLAELLKDSAFLAKIKASNRLVNLTYDAGTQSYTGSFSDLGVTGVYRLIYTVTNSDTNGVMNRYYLKSFNVRFKDVDLGASNVAVMIDSLTHNAIIGFRPISSTGKYIGPGWGSSIGLAAPGLSIQRVEDLGDGTYKLHLSGPLSGNGVLTIANDTVYSGALGDITKGNSGGGTGGVFSHWWFWLLLLLVLLLIIWGLRKKNP